MVKISTNIVDITPTEPTFIGGHAMREGKYTGVHDRIKAIIQWLEVDNVKFLMVQADLSNFDGDFVHLFKYSIIEKYQIKYDNIILCANHTHSGPILTTRKEDQPHDPNYRKLVMDNILAGVEACKNDLKEVAKVMFTTGVSTDFYGNRNSKNKYGDNNIYLVEFKDVFDKNLAAIVNISCHSTVLSPEDTEISGDLLAALRRELVSTLCVEALVCQGNSGDMSNRLYRQANDYHELIRVSKGIGEQIAHFDNKMEINLANPQVRSFIWDVEYDTNKEKLQKTLEEAEAKLQTATQYDERKWLLSEIASFKRKLKVDHVKLELETTIMRFNDLEIIVMPCELVSAFGKQIKHSSNAKACFTWGYANGQTGYVVEASEFGGGHDGISTQLPKGKAEEYVGLIIQNLF